MHDQDSTMVAITKPSLSFNCLCLDWRTKNCLETSIKNNTRLNFSVISTLELNFNNLTMLKLIIQQLIDAFFNKIGAENGGDCIVYVVL